MGKPNHLFGDRRRVSSSQGGGGGGGGGGAALRYLGGVHTPS